MHCTLLGTPKCVFWPLFGASWGIPAYPLNQNRWKHAVNLYRHVFNCSESIGDASDAWNALATRRNALPRQKAPKRHRRHSALLRKNHTWGTRLKHRGLYANMFTRVPHRYDTVIDLFWIPLFADTCPGFPVLPAHGNTCGKPSHSVYSVVVVYRQLWYLCHNGIVAIPGAQPTPGRFNSK